MEDDGFIMIGDKLVKFEPTPELRYERRRGSGGSSTLLKQKCVAIGILSDGSEHTEIRWCDIPLIDLTSD